MYLCAGCGRQYLIPQDAQHCPCEANTARRARRTPAKVRGTIQQRTR